MKRTARALAAGYLLVSALLISVIAAGGDASDPLISLSYLNGTYASTVDSAAAVRLNAADETLLAALDQRLSGAEQAACAETWTEVRLKQGDVLSGVTGTGVLVLAGSVQVRFSSGAVVDVTAGAAVSSGASLTAGHRYLTAEDTAAAFTVASRTAVVQYQGYYGFALSGAVDYNAMASALKTMHLFRGSFTGYGSGYDLELAPTRLQALIMFLRVLGEEEAALACTGSTPFTDVGSGTDAAKYVAYAYEKGYTNGYTATLWKGAQPVNAHQYTEFILRALGYSSADNRDLSGTLEKAAACGVLTSGETAALKTLPFLRADLAYISYYALDATVAGTASTLRDTLCAKGVFTAAEAASAQALVPGSRIF